MSEIEIFRPVVVCNMHNRFAQQNLLSAVLEVGNMGPIFICLVEAQDDSRRVLVTECPASTPHSKFHVEYISIDVVSRSAMQISIGFSCCEIQSSSCDCSYGILSVPLLFA